VLLETLLRGEVRNSNVDAGLTVPSSLFTDKSERTLATAFLSSYVYGYVLAHTKYCLLSDAL
jgi:hypothetical protein